MGRDRTRSTSTLSVSEQGERLAFKGSLDMRTLADAQAGLQRKRFSTLELDGVERMDTSAALWLRTTREGGVRLAGLRPEHEALLDLIDRLDPKPLPEAPAVPHWRKFVVQMGKGADDAWHETLAVITYTGRVVAALLPALLHPARLRHAAISRHVVETGVNAMPIIALMAVMISVVIGYQGVAQLRQYGGEDYTINLVAVSMLREMGVLVTAIMVAGRSGSAFTAELGVMKARDEVDALQVMGLDAMQMLVLPRVVALVLTLPLLTFFADAMGLLGGALTAQALLDVAPQQYLARVRQAVDDSDLFVGLLKAPVFAFFIAAIGCMHGLRVHGSAESVGAQTTRAVVKAIFLVIVLDALFSVLFERLGW